MEFRECKVCGGTYQSESPPGVPYQHVCGPDHDPQTGELVAREIDYRVVPKPKFWPHMVPPIRAKHFARAKRKRANKVGKRRK
jgi:hypothetical protein